MFYKKRKTYKILDKLFENNKKLKYIILNDLLSYVNNKYVYSYLKENGYVIKKFDGLKNDYGQFTLYYGYYAYTLNINRIVSIIDGDKIIIKVERLQKLKQIENKIYNNKH